MMLKHLNASETRPKRVVILGAGGFVGNSIWQRLLKENIHVLGLTRKEVDLLKGDSELQLEQILQEEDSLVVAAAKAPCKNSAMLLDNIKMMEVVCRVLEKKKLYHVIYISSDAVYADLDEPITEKSLTAPNSLHGVMHLSRELMLKSALKNSPLCILRPSLLYGARDPHNGYGPNQFRRLVQDGKDIVLFGEGEEQRDHVFIEDVAEIIRLCLFHRSEGILNIATGKVFSFKKIAQEIVELFNSKCHMRSKPRVGPMPHNGYRPFQIDMCLKAFPTFKFHSLEEGLKKI